MVATQQEKVLRILDFVRQQQADRFQRLFATIHVIAEEQVVGFRWKTAVFEQTQQIVVLSVYIPCKSTKLITLTPGYQISI